MWRAEASNSGSFGPALIELHHTARLSVVRKTSLACAVK
jgi:hypothetical protein